MITLYSRLLGIDPELVKRQPNGSRLKIITLGQLLMIPVLLWFTSGYFIASNLLSIEWYYAILCGLVCAGMIYLIDRSFITAYGNSNVRLMRTLRMVFAVLSGILGSIALDTAIFEGDIAQYQSKMAGANYETVKTDFLQDKQTEINRASAERDKAQSDYNALNTAFINEMDGKGTGQVGYGKVAKQKKKAAVQAKILFDKKELDLSDLRNKLEIEAESHATGQTAVADNTVMQKIHDFHAFVGSSWHNIIFYFLFFLLIFLAETMLILYKIGSAKTALDEAILAEEIAAKQRVISLNRQREKYNNALAELGEPNVRNIVQLSSN